MNTCILVVYANIKTKEESMTPRTTAVFKRGVSAMTSEYLSPPAAILVAIADDVVRNALSTHLKEEGYPVITAADGTTAFSLATRHPLLLALLDFQLPQYDGL